MFDISGYYEGENLQETFEFLAKHPKATLIAGGTDALVKTRERKVNFIETTFVGITRLPQLREVFLDQDETLVIGACKTFTEIEQDPLILKHAPLLSLAVSNVGSPQTRNVGTLGGNICNGATSADSAPALFTYNALLEIHSREGVKEVPIAAFYKGAGWVDLNPGELLVKIKITKENYQGFKGHYTKFAQRKALDIANLSCATLLKAEEGRIKDLRICFGVAGPTPIRMAQAEAYAIGKLLTDETLTEIGRHCLADSRTRDSWRASKEYRDHLVQLLPGRNIQTILGRG